MIIKLSCIYVVQNFRVRCQPLCYCIPGDCRISLQWEWEQWQCLARYIKIIHLAPHINNIVSLSCIDAAGIPQDGSPINVTTEQSLLVVGPIYTFSFVGIIFAFVCLGFNVIFRNRKWAERICFNLAHDHKPYSVKKEIKISVELPAMQYKFIWQLISYFSGYFHLNHHCKCSLFSSQSAWQLLNTENIVKTFCSKICLSLLYAWSVVCRKMENFIV